MTGADDDEKTGPVASDADRPGLGALFARLVDDGETFIRAEVRLYRAQATRKAFSAGLIVALIGSAIMLTQALLITVSIGVVMILAPKIGMGWAVSIVATVTLILIAICVLIGNARISTLLKPEEPS
ncbi:hypothetical protein BH09PSE3_BH09PSE3_07790 [soil metagenome]